MKIFLNNKVIKNKNSSKYFVNIVLELEFIKDKKL
jgi:hypothetical protein